MTCELLAPMDSVVPTLRDFFSMKNAGLIFRLHRDSPLEFSNAVIPTFLGRTGWPPELRRRYGVMLANPTFGCRVQVFVEAIFTRTLRIINEWQEGRATTVGGTKECIWHRRQLPTGTVRSGYSVERVWQRCSVLVGCSKVTRQMNCKWSVL
ncbi:hypothetical protein J6590_037553 [Homalodisca vitripennis]|nr:hypothetical protein J6590_037553 [Homalodisca vitripennis]